MKIKILTLLLLLCLSITANACTFANASTDVEIDISDLAMKDDRIVHAVAVVKCRNCVVALQTNGFASKSQYDKFVEELTNTIKGKYEIDNVYVSRNPKVMLIAEKIAKSEANEREKIISDLVKQLTKRQTELPFNVKQ